MFRAASRRPTPDVFAFRAAKAPPNPGLEGPYAKNTALRDDVTLIDLSAFGHGPEDVAFDSKGNLYAGLAEGRIVRIPKGSQTPQLFAEAGLGRPLGMAFAPDGSLIVCDAKKGLLRVDTEGKVTKLLTAVDGQPLVFPNNLAVTKKGVVYFTDSSRKFPQSDYIGEVLAHDDGGRLIRFDLATKEASVAAKGLFFPNGVALAKDETSLVVAEMNTYRLLRFGLEGPGKGTLTPFVENLPGFPDNVASDDRGNVWVGLSSLRSPIRDALLPHPWARKALSWLPRKLLPQPKAPGFVLAFDPGGKPIANLQDPSGRLSDTTTALPYRDEFVVVSSLQGPALGRVPYPSSARGHLTAAPAPHSFR